MSATTDPAGYYQALGVPRSATADEIRLAFRSRAMSAHPDRAGATAADGEAFRLIREAYEVLRDPRQRMAYDAAVYASRPGNEAPAEAHTTARPEAAASGASAKPPPEPQASAAGPGKGGRHQPGHARRLFAAPDWALRFAPLGALGLALLLLLALGALWSANRQLADQKLLINDLYGRQALQGETKAELNTQYRSLAFLNLERALRLGQSTNGTVRADAGAAAYLHTINFGLNGSELTPEAQSALGRALIEIAAQIASLPADADWLIVLDAQARLAAFADQVAVDAWEPALMQLATVLDHLLAQGLPGERLAIRFAAGFGGSAAPETPIARSATDAATPSDRPDGSAGQVLIKLICCGS